MNESSETIMSGIQNVAELIRSSQIVTVLTGAGISTPSGIPDFRSPDQGLWNKLDPFEVASLTNFRYDPELFYKLMRPLAMKIHAAIPNTAHLGLAQLEKAGHIQTIITQNIDMLHQRAGSKHVLEVHGSFRSLTCISCYSKTSSEGYIEPYLQEGQVPTCPKCDNILKPDLILMGEQLPAQTWLKAVETSKHCNLMIIAGSSLEVLPVAGLPMRAFENGAHLVIINHSPTYLDVRADVVIHAGVETIIPCIVEEVLIGQN